MPKQFLATAGVTYKNPVSGREITFSQDQLDNNPAMGMLSEQYVALPSVQGPGLNTGGSNTGNLTQLMTGNVPIGITQSVNEVDTGSENIRDDVNLLNDEIEGLSKLPKSTGASTSNPPKQVWVSGTEKIIVDPFALEEQGINLIKYLDDLAFRGFKMDPEASDLLNKENEEPENQTSGVVGGVDLMAEFAKIQQMTADNLSEIEAAGEAAGAEFDPLIADARERALYGQAANVVATGRRGGFQRTRYAGEAALGPTVDDVGYEGSGGKLEASASAYRRNIDALEAQKMRAIDLAKAQARQAIRQGKQQDFDNTKAILEFARQLDKDIKEADQQRFENEFKTKQEQRLADESNFNIISKIPAGESQVINGRTYEGIAVEEVDPFWTSASIVSLMKELPVGETKTVYDPKLGEIQVTGMKITEPNTQVFKSVNQNTGDETFTTIDQNTGKILHQEISKGTGAVYKASSGGGDSSKLTSTELKKLEAAGLLNSPRHVQLSYLYGENVESTYNDFYKRAQEMAAEEQSKIYGDMSIDPYTIQLDPILMQKSYVDYINEQKRNKDVKDENITENWFSNEQLNQGAKSANMKIEDFKKLSVDEANKYIY